MTKFILGTKEKMTQVFNEEGRAFPATIIQAGPVTVTQVRTQEKDGYEAVQVGYGSRKERLLSKAFRGHLKDLPSFAHMKEFRGGGEYKRGDTIDVSIFEEGDEIQVTGISKGKGFQGVVKRHGFHGGPASHGQKHSHREPGSIGATGPQRVFKGTKMAGRMGADTVTVKNLKVLGIDKDNNQIIVSGAVPGRRGTLISIISA